MACAVVSTGNPSGAPPAMRQPAPRAVGGRAQRSIGGLLDEVGDYMIGASKDLVEETLAARFSQRFVRLSAYRGQVVPVRCPIYLGIADAQQLDFSEVL